MELAVEEYTVTRAVSGALGVVAIALHHQAKHSRTASKDQHINSPGAFPFFFFLCREPRAPHLYGSAHKLVFLLCICYKLYTLGFSIS
jgi:hypothetical protein